MATDIHPLLSICIPSYNRPKELLRLLHNLSEQDGDFEVVIAEDCAPKRQEIKDIVEIFTKQHPDLPLHLHLNEYNYGYDKNIRSLTTLAKGDYIMFFGDDDVMTEGCLQKVCEILKSQDHIGVLLRAWEERDHNNKVIEFSRYSNENVIYPAGRKTLINFFRKSIFISGLTVHRETAIKKSTEALDGTLLYQLYLVSNILLEKKGFYLSDIIVTRMAGNEFFFGSSESEAALFVPNELNYHQSLNFMSGVIKVIDYLENENNISIKKPILKSFSQNSYGFLEIQRRNGFTNFIRYCQKLHELGFGSAIQFKLYSIVLLICGSAVTNSLMLTAKYLIKGKIK